MGMMLSQQNVKSYCFHAAIHQLLQNCSLRLGKLPAARKIAKITPVPKQGNSSNPCDYKPISLLSIVKKLLERHLAEMLIDHFTVVSLVHNHCMGLQKREIHLHAVPL